MTEESAGSSSDDNTTIEYTLLFELKTKFFEVRSDRHATEIGHRIDTHIYNELKGILGDSVIYVGPPKSEYHQGSLLGLVSFLILSTLPNVLPVVDQLSDDSKMEVLLRPAVERGLGRSVDFRRFSSHGAIWGAGPNSAWGPPPRGWGVGPTSALAPTLRGEITTRKNAKRSWTTLLLLVPLYLLLAWFVWRDQTQDQREILERLGRIECKVDQAGIVLTPADDRYSVAVLFARGSSSLSPETRRVLVQFAQANSGARVVVQGYADPTGDYSYNLSLSIRRAQAVAALLGENGIQVQESGVGRSRTDEFGADAAQNRRVVVRLASSLRSEVNVEECD